MVLSEVYFPYVLINISYLISNPYNSATKTEEPVTKAPFCCFLGYFKLIAPKMMNLGAQETVFWVL